MSQKSKDAVFVLDDESNTMPDQYFYHSFPRRGANSAREIDKGCAIIRSMCEVGLALIPEFLEWQQPLSNGQYRSFPKVQQRACFTELALAELEQHADRFGHFSIEIEQLTMRRMGGIPVFYIPSSEKYEDGSALGMYLLSVASDAHALLGRINAVNNILRDARVADTVEISTGFSEGPEPLSKFTIDAEEGKKFLDMLGNALTPWDMLEYGLGYILNMFYPADDFLRNKPLDYYRQREWRIAGAFAVGGDNIIRSIYEEEKNRISEIDPDFFLRKIKPGIDDSRMIDRTLIFPSIGQTPFMQLVHRVIVPEIAVEQVTSMVAAVAPAVEIVTLERLRDQGS